MIKFSAYIKELILTILLFSSASLTFAIQDDFVGTWRPVESAFPTIKISQHNGILSVQAQGSFIEEGTKGIVHQATASSQRMGITVRFPMKQGEAVVHLKSIGMMMEARWETNMLQSNYQPGVVTYQKEMVSKTRGMASGAIKGQVTGQARSTAGIFHISLYGPNNPRQFVQTRPLGVSKSFHFESLPDGKYWIFVESRGHTVIEAFPSQKQIVVKNGEVVTQNVELR